MSRSALSTVYYTAPMMGRLRAIKSEERVSSVAEKYERCHKNSAAKHCDRRRADAAAAATFCPAAQCTFAPECDEC